MGLLSGLLTVGGAALGSVVPGVGTALGASLGGALGGALDQSGASKKASKAQIAALNEARGIEKGAYTDVQGYQKPYMDLGSGAVSALTGRLRLGAPPTATAPAAQPNALTGGLPQVGAGPGADVIDLAKQADGSYAMPSAAAAPPATTPASAPPTTTNALTGQPAGSAPQADPGTYGNATNPSYTAPTAPSAFSYGLDDYRASPAYQYQQDQARKSILASAGATGALQSGAALKELQDRAQNIALLDFTNERNFALGLNRNQRSDYQDDRNFGRDIYADDRNYLTNRFDQGTSDLFRATNVGQGAANVTSQAASRYGDQVAGLVTDAGNAKAQNALTQGQIGSDLATGLGGIIAGGFKSPQFSAGGGSGSVGTMVDPSYANALRAPSVYAY